MKAEGAISIQAPANQPYGGRSGTIQDPFGNTWYVSSQTKKDEPERRTPMASAKLFRVALQVADFKPGRRSFTPNCWTIREFPSRAARVTTSIADR
jgi:hypothetical protein